MLIDRRGLEEKQGEKNNIKRNFFIKKELGYVMDNMSCIMVLFSEIVMNAV